MFWPRTRARAGTSPVWSGVCCPRPPAQSGPHGTTTDRAVAAGGGAYELTVNLVGETDRFSTLDRSDGLRFSRQTPGRESNPGCRIGSVSFHAGTQLRLRTRPKLSTSVPGGSRGHLRCNLCSTPANLSSSHALRPSRPARSPWTERTLGDGEPLTGRLRPVRIGSVYI